MKHVSTVWKYATLTKCIKVQHGKKLHQIQKYTECRFWANIHKIYWDFSSTRIISLQEKTLVETISVAINNSSDHAFIQALLSTAAFPQKILFRYCLLSSLVPWGGPIVDNKEKILGICLQIAIKCIFSWIFLGILGFYWEFWKVD